VAILGLKFEAKFAMQIERSVWVDINKLHPNPWNPNRRSDRKSKALRGSIAHFGQFAEILVRVHPEDASGYQILDGEHRYKDLLAAGEDGVFVNIIEVSDFDARKLTLIANDGGDNDREALAELITELTDLCDGDLGELTDSLPLDYEDISELLEFAGGEPEESEEPGIKEVQAPKKELPEDNYSEVSRGPKEKTTEKTEKPLSPTMKGLRIPLALDEYDRAYRAVEEASAMGIAIGSIVIAAIEAAITIEKELDEF
jgi:ParB-like chromosome segregation protein Spo0J